MKRISAILLSFIIAAAVMFSFSAIAADGSFSSVNKEAEVGSTFTAVYSVKSGSVAQAYVSISYPEDQLKLTEVSSAVTGWTCTQQSGGYYISPADPENVLSGPSPLVNLTFKVLEGAQVGGAARVSLSGSVTSVAGSDSDGSPISGSFSIKIAQSAAAADTPETEEEPEPPTLSSLTIEKATISPAFNPKTFVYDVTVPYEIQKLNIAAVAADPNTQITVEDTPLSETEVTSVVVNLRSSTGTSMYNLRVTREERKKDSNNKLSALNVEGFPLSPAFSADVTQYVVWVPYETETVKVAGTAESQYATATVTGGETLEPGKFNEVVVSCTSETELINEYRINVYRAAEGEGISKDKQVVEPDKEKEDKDTKDKTDTIKTETTSGNNSFPALIIGFIIGAAVAVAVTLLIIRFRFNKPLHPNDNKQEDAMNIDGMFFGENDYLFDGESHDDTDDNDFVVNPDTPEEHQEETPEEDV